MKEYFCAYHSMLRTMKRLDDAERGRLFTALLEYSMTGEEPENLTGREAVLFDVYAEQIDRDTQKYETKVEQGKTNGNKGGRPAKKNQTVGDETQNNPRVIAETQNNPRVFEETQKTQDKDKDKDKDKDNIEEEGEEETRAREPEAETDPRFIDMESPWVQFVRDYEQNVGPMPPSGRALERLQSDFDTLGADVITEAIKATSEAFADNPQVYFNRLCAEWIRRGIRTADAARTDIETHRRRKGGGKNGAHRDDSGGSDDWDRYIGGVVL